MCINFASSSAALGASVAVLARRCGRPRAGRPWQPGHVGENLIGKLDFGRFLGAERAGHANR